MSGFRSTHFRMDAGKPRQLDANGRRDPQPLPGRWQGGVLTRKSQPSPTSWDHRADQNSIEFHKATAVARAVAVFVNPGRLNVPVATRRSRFVIDGLDGKADGVAANRRLADHASAVKAAAAASVRTRERRRTSRARRWPVCTTGQPPRIAGGTVAGGLCRLNCASGTGTNHLIVIIAIGGSAIDAVADCLRLIGAQEDVALVVGTNSLGGKTAAAESSAARNTKQPLSADLVQIARDQHARVRVNGEPAVLVGLNVLADAPPAADDVIEGDMHQAPVEVDVADLQAVELVAAHALSSVPRIKVKAVQGAYHL